MSRLSLLALQDEHFAACWTSISLPAGRFETIQERSAGGLALIISALFSGEGWGGVGWDLGQGQTQGLFYGQSGTQYHAVPDHLQSFCWPVLLIPSKLFEGEEKFKMKH